MQEFANHRGIMRLQQDIYQNFPQGQPNPYMLPLKETDVKVYDVNEHLLDGKLVHILALWFVIFCFDFYF